MTANAIFSSSSRSRPFAEGHTRNQAVRPSIILKSQADLRRHHQLPTHAMHGWGVSRGLSHSSQLSHSRLPIMHSYASLASESSPLPPYAPPLSTPVSRSLPLQILLALFTTLVVLSSVLQFAGLGQSLRYVDDGSPIAAPMVLMAAQTGSPLDSDVFRTILERLDEQTDDASASFTIAYHGKEVHDGDFVSMSEAATAPSIAIDDGKALFTWMLIDIDAPDPEDPSHAPFLHYIVADLDAKSHEEDEGAVTMVEPKQVVVPYYPVTPPTGEHRYVSLLFRQQAAQVDIEQNERLSEQRANFDVAAYAKDHGLVLAKTAHFYSKPEGQ